MNFKALSIIIKSSIANTLLFKGSLLIKIVTVLLSELSSIFVMFIMLSKFQGYGELTSGQFVFMYFFAHVSYSICMLFFNNLRVLGFSIQMGYFDRMLLMPINTMAYICSYNFDFAGIGQVITSLVLFILFGSSYGIVWSGGTILYVVVLQICSILILASILIILSSAAYFTIDWKPLDNMFGAFREMMWYPLTIYNRVVQVILYSFVPVAYIVYVPSGLMFECSGMTVNTVLTMAGYLAVSAGLFAICYKIWFYQSRKYQSVG